MQLTTDKTILEAAIIGFGIQQQQLSVQQQQLESRARKIRERLADISNEPAAAPAPKRKRHLSAAARRAISISAKKRWAAYRKQNGKIHTMKGRAHK